MTVHHDDMMKLISKFYISQANREQLDEYLALLEAARNDDKHADAVIWKFCDLDVDPEDR